MNILTKLIIIMSLLTLVACGGAEQRKNAYLERGKALLAQHNYEKARIEFKNVLQIDPKSADGWYFLGRAQENQRNFREAMGSYNKAVELDTQYHAAKTATARIYLFAGMTDKSLELVQQVLVNTPDDVDALVVYAGGLHRSGKADQAIIEATKALAKDANDIGALAMMVRIDIDTHKTSEAEALLTATLARNDNDEIRHLLIQFYKDTGQQAMAVPHMQYLVKNYPDNMDYRNQLAGAYDSIDQSGKAEEVLRSAVTELPDNYIAKVSLIQFLSQRRDARLAQAELEKFIQADTKNPDLKLLSAQLHIKNNDPAAAEKIWRDIMLQYHQELPAATAHMELIRMLLRDTKRISDVKSELAALMKDYPAFSDGLILRGKLAMDDGRYVEAINDFRAVLKDQPTAVPVIKLLASSFMQTGQPELAEDQLKAALSQAPRDPQVHIQMAQVFQQQKKYENAKIHLEIAQKLSPDSLAATEMLFRNYLALRDYNSANSLASAVVRDHPELANGYILQGLLLQAQGKNRESMAPLERALAINKMATEPLNLLARAAIATNQVAVIKTRLQSIVNEHPEYMVAANLLGELALQQKEYKQAYTIFRQITQKKPDWWLGWRNLAQTTQMQNQPDKAIDIYRQGISACQDERLVISLALLFEQLGLVNEAIAVYDDALIRTPASASITNNLALLLVNKQRDQASQDRALNLVKAFETSENANNLDTLGWVYYQRGDYDMALKALLKAESLSPDSVITQYHLAFAYYGNGNHDQAKKYLQAAIRSEPALAKRDDVVQIMEKLKLT